MPNIVANGHDWIKGLAMNVAISPNSTNADTSLYSHAYFPLTHPSRLGLLLLQTNVTFTVW